MRNYEATYYFLPSLEESAVQTLNEKLSAQITDKGGEIVKLTSQGKKRLAFPIKGHSEGFFSILEFKSESEPAKELDRMLRITDEVLRSMIVRLKLN